MHIWLNGQSVTPDEAMVSIFDAGFQHGVGLFETMHVRNGRVYRLMSHLQRLSDSAKALMLTERLRLNALVEAIDLAVEQSGLTEARVRLTITGGDLNMLQSTGESAVDPTILIVVQPATKYPDAFFEEGVRVTIANGRLNPLDPMAGHKTLNYWARIQALQVAAARGGGESLWFTVSNHLASGSVSNIFMVADDILRTPLARGEEDDGALVSPVLPGITRGTIIEHAAHLGIGCERRLFDIEELLEADEVFLTNSSWGVLPVVGVERESIAGGVVGPITRRLREAWLADVQDETSATPNE